MGRACQLLIAPLLPNIEGPHVIATQEAPMRRYDRRPASPFAVWGGILLVRGIPCSFTILPVGSNLFLVGNTPDVSATTMRSLTYSPET